MGKVIPTLTNTTYITKILPQKCPKTTSKLPQNFWISSDPLKDALSEQPVKRMRLSYATTKSPKYPFLNLPDTTRNQTIEILQFYFASLVDKSNKREMALCLNFVSQGFN